MPIAKIHVAEGRFDEARLEKVSQEAIRTRRLKTCATDTEGDPAEQVYGKCHLVYVGLIGVQLQWSVARLLALKLLQDASLRPAAIA